MKIIKTVLTVFMAVLILILSFSVVYADDSEEGSSRENNPGYVTGYFNGDPYYFDVRQSSSTLLNAVAAHRDSTKKIKYTFKLCYFDPNTG